MQPAVRRVDEADAVAQSAENNSIVVPTENDENDEKLRQFLHGRRNSNSDCSEDSTSASQTPTCPCPSRKDCTRRRFIVWCGSVTLVVLVTLLGFFLYIRSRFASAAGGHVPQPTPTPLPQAPKLPSCSALTTTAAVHWTPAEQPNTTAPVLRYEIEHDSGGDSNSAWLEGGASCPQQSVDMRSFCQVVSACGNTTATCCVPFGGVPGGYNFTGLNANTTYRVRVRAWNSNNNGQFQAGNWSRAASCTTQPPGAPNAPGSLALVNSSASSMVVGWRAPTIFHGTQLVGYQMQVRKVRRVAGAGAGAGAGAAEVAVAEAAAGLTVGVYETSRESKHFQATLTVHTLPRSKHPTLGLQLQHFLLSSGLAHTNTDMAARPGQEWMNCDYEPYTYSTSTGDMNLTDYEAKKFGDCLVDACSKHDVSALSVQHQLLDDVVAFDFTYKNARISLRLHRVPKPPTPPIPPPSPGPKWADVCVVKVPHTEEREQQQQQQQQQQQEEEEEEEPKGQSPHPHCALPVPPADRHCVARELEPSTRYEIRVRSLATFGAAVGSSSTNFSSTWVSTTVHTDGAARTTHAPEPCLRVHVLHIGVTDVTVGWMNMNASASARARPSERAAMMAGVIDAAPADGGAQVLGYKVKIIEVPAIRAQAVEKGHGREGEGELDTGRDIDTDTRITTIAVARRLGEMSSVPDRNSNSSASPQEIILVVEGSSNCTIDIPGLKPSTKYAITVQAFNSRGCGEAGDPVMAITLREQPPSAPGPPQSVLVTSGNISVQWAASETHGMAVHAYEVQHDNWWIPTALENGHIDSVPVKANGHSLQFMLTNLLPASTYRVRVRAVSYGSDSGGIGGGNTYSDWSASTSIATNEAGGCGNRKDVGAMQQTKATMQHTIQSCLIGCALKSASCATNCIESKMPFSHSCAECWTVEGSCTVQHCAGPCISPGSQRCKDCSETKCFPACVDCSGVPMWAFPDTGLPVPP